MGGVLTGLRLVIQGVGRGVKSDLHHVSKAEESLFAIKIGRFAIFVKKNNAPGKIRIGFHQNAHKPFEYNYFLKNLDNPTNVVFE